VIGHLGINVGDLAAAQAYYDRVLPLLDFEGYLADDDQVAYRPARGKPGTYLFLYPAPAAEGYDRRRPGLQHLAFMVPTRGRVHEVHDLVRDLGSEVVLAPQELPQYPPPYFAAFWHDPHGFVLEAVCHHDRD
jgi:catechol 2,3-dioxygenase-like lactoylglutathione lyase family enzyme